MADKDHHEEAHILGGDGMDFAELSKDRQMEYDLMPVGRKSSLLGKLGMYLVLCIVIPIYIIFFVLVLLLLLLAVITLVGPISEHLKSRRDNEILNNTSILRDHPEMFLMEIPANINSASGGKPYKLMVRMTKPKTDPQYPPVVFPGMQTVK